MTVPPRNEAIDLLRWVSRVAAQYAARPFGQAHRFTSIDRRWLEGIVLPHYGARRPPMTVLFVGANAQTAHYQDAFFAAHRFVTIDIDPVAMRYGSRDRHIVDCASRIERYFTPASVDLIICNGVFGWGLNDAARMHRCMTGFARVMKPNAELLIGYNDLSGRRPRGLGAVGAAVSFEQATESPLGAAVVQAPGSNRHCFEFWRRRDHAHLDGMASSIRCGHDGGCAACAPRLKLPRPWSTP